MMYNGTMKRKNTLLILFSFLVPFLIAYYIAIVIRDRVGRNKKIVKTERKNAKKIAVKAKKNLSTRQNNIISYISKKGVGKVSDMAKTFKGVTERTLRRDLNKLEEDGLVVRSGSTKSVTYRIK